MGDVSLMVAGPPHVGEWSLELEFGPRAQPLALAPGTRTHALGRLAAGIDQPGAVAPGPRRQPQQLGQGCATESGTSILRASGGEEPGTSQWSGIA